MYHNGINSVFSALLYLVTFLSMHINGEDYYDVNYDPKWNLIDRDSCGENLKDRIIGGTNAGLGEYPWLVRLGYSKLYSDTPPKYACGGALITPCWIISAAHCIDAIPEDLFLSTIRLGEYNVNEEIDCNADECADRTQDIPPRSIIVHKDYGTPKYKNDIVMIALQKPARMTKFVRPICLPYGPLLHQDLKGKNAHVAGWGIDDIQATTTSDILQTISLPIVSLESCVSIYGHKTTIDNDQLCVGGQKGRDSCTGDSGGPLMKVDVITTPKYYLFGIVSFGPKMCGVKAKPAVYTKITAYIPWILKNIEKC